MRRVIEASINESKDKSLSKQCDILVKLMDKVNKNVRNKVNQIKSLNEFDEEVKVSSGDIIELTRKLDQFLSSVISLRV